MKELKRKLSEEEMQELNSHLDAIAPLLAKLGRRRVILNLPGERPRGADLPSILLNTLPKSGSVYIQAVLRGALGLGGMGISAGTFPNDYILLKALELAARGGCVVQEHVPANPVNLKLIGLHLDRLVVHVRDPRQSTLSWTHYLDELAAKEEHSLLALSEPARPDGYHDWPFEEKLDWQIDHYLTACMRWIEGWLDAEADHEFTPRILFTRYEDFVADQPAFFRNLLDFFAIDREAFSELKVPTGEGVMHFRKGETDEWRSVFSDSQRARAGGILSERVARRFEYSP